MRRLRSETPLRRQKGSLRKSISPDLGPRASPAGWLASKRACGRSATGDRGALPLDPAALTGRFASLRARGLRPAFEKA